MKKNRLFVFFGLAGLFLFSLFLPTHYRRTILEGTDRFEAHYPLWGTRQKIVSITAQSSISGVGFVLVNLRHAASVAPVHVRVLQTDGTVISELDTALAGNADDAFTWATFPRVIARTGEQVIVEVTAPAAQQSSAIGIRFDTDTGNIALALEERIPLWESIMRWAHENPDLAQKVEITIGGGLLLALLLWGIDVLLTSPNLSFVRRGDAGLSPLRRGSWRGLVWIFSLFVLFLCTIAIRIPLAHSIDSAYGGDAFNYLLKSRAWIDGHDPFAADPRKAPLYSFLAMPGLATPFDAMAWERWVNIFAAGGTIILTSLFLKRLGVPNSIALGGGVLLAVNRDFQFESVQGLSNTVYTFFVLLAGYVFIIGRPYMLAVASGLAFLTRYEGGAVAAMLMPFLFLQKNISIIKKYTSLGVLIFLLAFPFILFPFSHSIGIRTLSDIQSDDGLYLTHSMDDFWSNFKGFRTLFGRMWILTPNIGSPFLAIGAGIVIGLVGAFLTSSPSLLLRKEKGGAPSPLVGSFFVLLPFIFSIIFLTLVIRTISEEAPFIVEIFSLCAGIGIGVALIRIPRKAIPIFFMLAVQIIVVTAILPKSRYYLPIIPYAAIAVTAGIYYMGGWKKSKMALAGSLLLLSLASGFTYADAQQALHGQVSDYNEKSAGQTVLLDATRAVKNLSGIVAVAEGSDLQTRSYLPNDRILVAPDSLRDIDAQLALMYEKNVLYIIDTTENPYFTKLIQERGQLFKEVSTFTTKWADVTATLYRMHRT